MRRGRERPLWLKEPRVVPRPHRPLWLKDVRSVRGISVAGFAYEVLKRIWMPYPMLQLSRELQNPMLLGPLSQSKKHLESSLLEKDSLTELKKRARSHG